MSEPSSPSANPYAAPQDRNDHPKIGARPRRFSLQRVMTILVIHCVASTVAFFVLIPIFTFVEVVFFRSGGNSGAVVLALAVSGLIGTGMGIRSARM